MHKKKLQSSASPTDFIILFSWFVRTLTMYLDNRERFLEKEKGKWGAFVVFFQVMKILWLVQLGEDCCLPPRPCLPKDKHYLVVVIILDQQLDLYKDNKTLILYCNNNNIISIISPLTSVVLICSLSKPIPLHNHMKKFKEKRRLSKKNALFYKLHI